MKVDGNVVLAFSRWLGRLGDKIGECHQRGNRQAKKGANILMGIVKVLR